MKLIQKHTASPFKLARSIVDQGGEGGAYESGGYNPDEYNRSSEIMMASLEAGSNMLGAALGSMTKGDLNKIRVKGNEKREKRISNIDKKLEKEVGTKKGNRLEEKKQRIQGRINKNAKKIEEYESVYGKDTSNDFLKKEREKSGYGF